MTTENAQPDSPFRFPADLAEARQHACAPFRPKLFDTMKAGVRYHFPLTSTAHLALHAQVLAIGAEHQFKHIAEAYYDTDDFRLLRAVPGGCWLRYREIDADDENGSWILRICDKMTPKGFMSCRDVTDEASILRFLSSLHIPGTATAKTLFAVRDLCIFARLLTARARYIHEGLDLTVDSTLLARGAFVLQGTVRAADDRTLCAMRELLRAGNFLAGEEAARSKVVEYVRRNNADLYRKLREWDVVTDEGFCEWHISALPALEMAPLLG